MKKIIGSILVLGSLVVLASGCSTGKAKLVNSQEVSIKDITNISVSYHSDSVNFYESDSDQLKIEEYLLTDKKDAKADIQKDDQSLSIKGGKRRGVWLTLNDNSHIDVYLPKDYKEKLAVQVTSGSLRASQNFDLKEFTGSANSGSLKLKAVKAETVALSTTSGAIKVNQLNATEATVKSSSGSVKIEDVISQKLSGNCTSGSIKIDRLKGEVDLVANSGSIKLGEVVGGAKLKATSGSIVASFTKVNGDIDATANSGSIKLIIPKQLSFDFSSQVSSGSTKTNFDQVLTKDEKTKTGTVGNDPEVAIATQITSGSIKVLREN